MAGVNAMAELASAFMAQDDWESVMEQNYLDNAHEIDGYGAQSYSAWKAGKAYDAGNLGGHIDTYLFKMPVDPQPVVSASAARDFYSGVMFGWTQNDLSTRWTRVSQMTRICLN